MVGYDGNQEHHLSQFWHGMAGVLSGTNTRFLCQPLDVLKIRFQLQHEPLRKSGNNYYWSLTQASLRIIREESIRGMWKGHVPAQMLSGVYGLVQFTTFEFLTKMIHFNSAVEHNKAAIHFLCGSVSGSVATVASMPFDTVRTRLVGQGEPKVYRGVVHAFLTMSREEGILSLYKGTIPTLMQIMPHAGIQFSCFQLFSQTYYAITKQDRSRKIPALGNLICGSSAGVVAKIAIYPLDLAKKRLQVQGFDVARSHFGKAKKYAGLFDCLKSTLIEEGGFGLYKGLYPSLIKAMFTSGLTFMFYEEITAIFVKLKL